MGKARKGLSADSILDAAMGIIEAEGADALSMRRLATEMGTTAMAFYNHFGDREALIDAIAARLYAAMSLPSDKLAWDKRLLHLLENFLDSARRWPRTWQVAMTRTVKPVSGQAVGGVALAALAEAGLDDESAMSAYFTLSMMIRGMLLWNGEHCQDPAVRQHIGLDAMMRQGMSLFLAGVRTAPAKTKPAARASRARSKP